MLENYTTGEKLKCFEALVNNIEEQLLNCSPQEDSIQLNIKATKLKSTASYGAIQFGKDFDTLNKMMQDIKNECLNK